MLRCAYHFANPGYSSGRDQANYFLNNGGGWSADGKTLPPLLDMEWSPYGDACYDMTPSQLISWVREFSNTVKARPGRVPMIYTGTSWWRDCMANTSAFADHPLHLAAYNNVGVGAIPAGRRTHNVWQYSATGPFDGDSNVWNGSLQGLKDFAKGSAATVRPTPTPTPSTPPKPALVLDRGVRSFGPGDFNADSRADLLSRRDDGTLWFYAGLGNGKFASPTRIGTGFQIYSAFIATGDYDGDGRNDFLARHVDGSLWRYSGTGRISSSANGYKAAVKIGASGWNAFTTLTSSGDSTGDGRADLIAVRKDGALFVYSGTGNGQHGSATLVGNGWNIYSNVLGVGDFTGDSRSDLLARTSDGKLWLYKGDGHGKFLARELAGHGWNAYAEMVGAWDYNHDGRPDLLGPRSDESLWFYAGTGSDREGYLAGKSTSGTWGNHHETVAAGDFSGDRHADIISRQKDGQLWLHAGTGTGSFRNQVLIGRSGWDAYTDVTAPGDFNGDRRSDLLARKADGSLWLYAGTATASSTSEGYKPAVKIGNSGWNIYSDILGPEDFNNDGHADVLARRPNGTLWLYAGTGKASRTNAGTGLA